MSLLDKFKKKEKITDKKAEVKKADVEVEQKKSESVKKAVKTAEVKKPEKKKASKKNLQNAYKVLMYPLVSEKAATGESRGEYVFIVDNKANKIEIKKAVEEIYGIKPKTVRIINVEGKKVRSGRTYGRRKDWKKAIVTLSKGQSISIHEGV